MRGPSSDHLLAHVRSRLLSRRQLLLRLLAAGVSLPVVRSFLRADATAAQNTQAPYETPPMPVEHFAYYVPGELTLLFKAVGLPQITYLREIAAPSMWGAMEPTLLSDTTHLLSGYPYNIAFAADAARGDAHEVRPFIPLDRGDQGVFGLHTFNLANRIPDWPLSVQEGLMMADAATSRAVIEVRDAVQAINQQILSSGPIELDGYQIVAAAPNWFTHSLQCCDAGCPGGRPVPPPPAASLNNFAPADVQAAVFTGIRATGRRPVLGNGPAAGYGVRVEIFDTFPPAGSPDSEIKLASNYLAGSSLDNGQLHTHLVAGTGGPPEPEYPMADHGLFVASIVRELAPMAQVTVHRVLSDMGTGDFHTTTRAVQAVLAQAAIDAENSAAGGYANPVVLNLSLGIGPHLLELGEYLRDPSLALQDGGAWSAGMRNMVKAPPAPVGTATWPYGTQAGDLSAALNDLSMLPVRTLFAVPTPNVLIVAASGNHSDWPSGLVVGPSMPAAIEGVVGVSAASRSGLQTYRQSRQQRDAYARYSNYDDVDAARDEGVTAFGGETITVTRSDGRSVSVSKDGDAIIGRYTSDVAFDPKTGDLLQASTSGTAAPGTWVPGGWAQWSGTSFAAPVVSGIAAAVWSEFRLPGSNTFTLPGSTRFSRPARGGVQPGIAIPFSLLSGELLEGLLKSNQPDPNIVLLA